MEENLIYRFRSLDRLLGKDRASGELDKLQIYFAHPSELNDPLEGYKDVYWRGDAIVWRNLFAHYISCLTQSCAQHFAALPEKSIAQTVPVRLYLDDLPPSQSELVLDVQQRVLSDPTFSRYIAAFGNFRKVRSDELIHYLSVAHRIILFHLFSTFSERELVPFKPEIILNNTMAHDLEICANVTASLSIFKNSSGFDEDEFTRASALMLANKLMYSESAIHESWFFLFIEYPAAYCKSLPDLTHPVWYTACFMSDCTNSSIWGSYGSNHTGVCLMFETQKSATGELSLQINKPISIGPNGITNAFQDMRLHKVDYERNFVEIDFFNSLGSLPIDTLKKYWYSDEAGNKSQCGAEVGSQSWQEAYWRGVVEANTVKLKDWEYEHEYRIMLHYSAIDISSREARQCTYDFNSLHGVIFGINTPTTDKVRIIKSIKKLCTANHRKSFRFYQARYNYTTNKIAHHSLDVDLKEISISD